MVEVLPSLTLLRTFEAAARHQSFRKAAEELHITPSAVSQQVKALEQHLGIDLFLRYSRRLRLTAEGARLMPGLTRGLEHVAAAVAELRAPPPTGTLTLNTAVSFAMHWLLPRMPRFRARLPGLALTLIADDRLSDLRAGGVDAAIRFGTGRYPGLRSDLIMPDMIYPACSPALLAAEDLFRDPQRLSRVTLIHDLDIKDGEPWMGWAPWLRELGLDEAAVDGHMRLAGAVLAIQAALVGLGVVLVRHALVADLGAAGRLVRLPLGVRRTEYAHYLVYPGGQADTPRITALRSWLAEEALHDTAKTSPVIVPPAVEGAI